MADSGLSDSNFYGSDSSDEDMRDMDQEVQMLFQCAIAATNSFYLFNSNEWAERGQQSVNSNVPVRDLLGVLKDMPGMFKTITNFTTSEFDELCTLVCPTIAGNARSTGGPRLLQGRPPKLSHEQRLLNFVWFMKHDNATTYDSFHWNWSASCVCDDAIFIASCLCYAIADEIRWPSAFERLQSGRTLLDFPGCIGFIDGTLVEIRRPHNNPQHRSWFNGRKKMYSMNNTMVVDHQGLFIAVDASYPGSFHDVNILRHSNVYKNWRDHFTHNEDYQEYVLGDPGYSGEDHFIMRRLGPRELSEDADEGLIKVYNKMHAGYRVRVEWGIGGLKQKWRRLMKRYDQTMPKYDDLFIAACLMTNFIHRRRMDFSYELPPGPPNEDIDEHGWHGDY